MPARGGTRRRACASGGSHTCGYRETKDRARRRRRACAHRRSAGPGRRRAPARALVALATSLSENGPARSKKPGCSIQETAARATLPIAYANAFGRLRADPGTPFSTQAGYVRTLSPRRSGRTALVVGLFGEDLGEVHADRADGRGPHQARADRGADGRAVGEAHLGRSRRQIYSLAARSLAPAPAPNSEPASANTAPWMPRSSGTNGIGKRISAVVAQ